MNKILIIDNNTTTHNSLLLEIDKKTEGIELLIANSMEDANRLIRANKKDIFLAIVDIFLSDTKDGDAVLLTNSHKIPTIISTDDIQQISKFLQSKPWVIECFEKKENHTLEYIIDFIKKSLRNMQTTILIVDDSQLFLHTLQDNCKLLHFNILTATNGQEALEMIQSTQEKISLVLTDYNMPLMNGIELTKKLREQYKKDTLAILALSASDDEFVLTEFIKAGANDYIPKPYNFTELSVRINAQLETLELFEKIKDAASRDYLTGSYNRRYFFEASRNILNKNARKESPIAVATLDIDNFKKINDTYGHNNGDIAIKEIHNILQKNLRSSDLFARFGGEEYCIILEDISLEDLKQLFEKLRRAFESNTITTKNMQLYYTVSFGVAFGIATDIDTMINISDEALYEAKESGRNRVIIYETSKIL